MPLTYHGFTLILAVSCSLPLLVIKLVSSMAATPDKSFGTPFGGSRSEDGVHPTAASPALTDDASADLMHEFEQLRDRFRRTTNALTSAAHDLKTPLAILNGYTELLQTEKLGGLNDRQREVLKDMHSSGHRLQHYTQDFLSFSVLETGELKMRFEAGNINVCLSEVCRLWSPRFQETALALYFLANDKVTEFPFDAPK